MRQQWQEIKESRDPVAGDNEPGNVDGGLSRSAPLPRGLRRRRNQVVVVAALIVVAAGVGTFVALNSASSASGCWRKYIVNHAGSVRDRDQHVVGEVRQGDEFRVDTLPATSKSPRYEGTVLRTGADRFRCRCLPGSGRHHLRRLTGPVLARPVGLGSD
jgi:hypothetical protein